MKILSKLFTLVLTIGMLSGCGPTTSEPTTVTPPESTGPTTVTGPSMEDFVDYVHTDTRARLTLDYKNSDGSSRNFFTDGIGQVELRNTIDGDTAHFNPVNATGSEYIKTRFYGIDTPESTGQIQLWGKSASKFTSEKLKNAAANGTIVLSSPSQTYAEPQVDSTGSRYLGLVWINETVKNADYTDLVLLNLWVVQEGYSATKSVDKVPEYAEVFFDADRQAQAYELHIWGDDIDPNYNYGDYEPVSIIAIKD